MRTTYIKKNSHTQQMWERFAKTTDVICMLAKISFGEWNAMIFDFGCEMAERKYMPEKVTSILTDDKYGYWHQVLRIWKQDDFEILQSRMMVNRTIYGQMKRALLEREAPPLTPPHGGGELQDPDHPSCTCVY